VLGLLSSCLTFLLVAVAHPDTVHSTAYPQQHDAAYSADVSHRDAGHRDTVIDVHDQHNAEVSLVLVLSFSIVHMKNLEHVV